MNKTVSALEFLRERDMTCGGASPEEIAALCREELERGLRGEESSLAMLPSFIRADLRPRAGEDVLIIDAGGSNLRAARARFDKQGKLTVGPISKRRMPGTDGNAISVHTLFSEMALLAREHAEGCAYGCISFSYPCESLPDGDARILSLCKELQVSDCEGVRVCETLESELRALGVSGQRKWRCINDSVGSMLGGIAVRERDYDDYIGFILGTGTNMCCSVPAGSITKSPECVSLGGEIIVNLEFGGLGRLVRGEADLALDAESEKPGDHTAEKMIAGRYLPRLLKKTLLLAAEDGILSAGTAEKLRALTMKARYTDEFYLSPAGGNPLADALADETERAFAHEVCTLLLRRAARISAGALYAILSLRAVRPGSRVCVCADGSMLRCSPALLPFIREELAPAERALGVTVDFTFADDATLLGCAWAGLL